MGLPQYGMSSSYLISPTVNLPRGFMIGAFFVRPILAHQSSESCSNVAFTKGRSWWQWRYCPRMDSKTFHWKGHEKFYDKNTRQYHTVASYLILSNHATYQVKGDASCPMAYCRNFLTMGSCPRGSACTFPNNVGFTVRDGEPFQIWNEVDLRSNSTDSCGSVALLGIDSRICWYVAVCPLRTALYSLEHRRLAVGYWWEEKGGGEDRGWRK